MSKKIVLNPELIELMSVAKQQYKEIEKELVKVQNDIDFPPEGMTEDDWYRARKLRDDLENEKARLFFTSHSVAEFAFKMGQQAIKRAREIVAEDLSDDATYNIGMYGEEFGHLLIKNSQGQCSVDEKIRLAELHELLAQDLFAQIGYLNEAGA